MTTTTHGHHAQQAVDIAELWASLTESELDQETRALVEERGGTAGLFDFSREVLVSSGLLARSWQGRSWHLPISTWLEAARHFSAGDDDAQRFVEWLGGIPRRRTFTCDNEVLHDVQLALHWRWRHRWFSRSFMPARKAIILPLDRIPIHEDLHGDDFEVKIGSLIASTTPHGQLSSTGHGEIFIGWHHGYHHASERIYVDGLSRALDLVASDLDVHRGPEQPIPGGQFFVEPDGSVRCAACGERVTHLSYAHRPAIQGPCPGDSAGWP